MGLLDPVLGKIENGVDGEKLHYQAVRRAFTLFVNISKIEPSST